MLQRMKLGWAWWRRAVSTEAADGAPARHVYFAGDTGYRTVRDGDDEDTAPRCPAFKEIGEKFGGFDLALLPIGYVGFGCAAGGRG